jgi:hypothetical protein
MELRHTLLNEQQMETESWVISNDQWALQPNFEALCGVSVFSATIRTAVIDRKLLQQVNQCPDVIQMLWKLSGARGTAPGEPVWCLNCKVAGHVLDRNLAQSSLQLFVIIFPTEHAREATDKISSLKAFR